MFPHEIFRLSEFLRFISCQPLELITACQFACFHGRDLSNYIILGCHIQRFWRLTQMFLRNILTPWSGQNSGKKTAI